MAELAHPERPLERGYARVTARDGQTLIHARDACEAGLLTLRFADGSVDAAVEGAAPAPPRPVERKPRRSYISPQPGLFDPPEE
jgi:exodeoxyribonuclease VII large subunit